MALTITNTGSEIATEKFVFTAVSDDPLVNGVLMDVLINSTVVAHTLEHSPILGTTDTFEFEINSIIKDYFASEFLALTGANQTVIENAIVGVNFFEVIDNVPSAVQHKSFVIIKNMTQDTFEIEDFDLNDYDCGDTGSDARKFLTSSPNPLPIGDKTSVHVSCLTASYTAGGGGSLTPNQEWVIQSFLAGALISTTTEDVNVATRSITSFVNSGKYDISNYRFDFDTSDGIDEVRISIRDIASPFTTRSETKVFKINDACERSITLSWLNEFGTQDTFTFLGNITRVGKYSDKTFKRVRPVNPLSTNVGDLVYKSDYNYQYDIFSDRMPELAVQWLSKILINKRAAIQTEAVDPNGNLNLISDDYYGSMSENVSYSNLVDAGNGFAYGAPNRAGDFIKYEIATDTITYIASALPAGVAGQYGEGVLSPVNGKIYYMKASISITHDVLVFDPSLETYTTFGTVSGASFYIVTPSITPTGVIYASVANGNSIFYKIDTNTDTITSIAHTSSGAAKSIYSPLGYVYFFSAVGTAEFYKLDVGTDIVTTIAAPNRIYGVFSAAITSQGFIYCNMRTTNLNYIFVVDTSDDSNYNIDTLITTNAAYLEVFVLSDDNVYFMGAAESNILKIDTSDDTFAQIGSIAFGSDYTNTMVVNDKVYSIPITVTEAVLKLTFTYDVGSKDGKYFPIVIETDETTLADKFTPETIFRLKFRLANRRKGLK